MQVLISILGFLLAITILVGFHEFGHFWVARRFGIRVLRFSIGFGKPFFSWYDKMGTEYVLSYIPLGGYVSLFGERAAKIPHAERPFAYSYKSVYTRMAVLFAGPFFNFLFAIIAYWLVFLIGVTTLAPIIGPVPVGSPAALAGLKQGQEIVSVEKKPTLTWNAVSLELMSEIGDAQTVNIMVRDLGGNGPAHQHTLDLSALTTSVDPNEDILKVLGLTMLDPLPPVVDKLLEGYPAKAAGMQPGDKILAVDDKPMHSRTALAEYIHPRIGKKVKVKIERGTEIKTLTIEPIASLSEENKGLGMLGVEFTQQTLPLEYVRTEHFGPIKALSEAIKRTWHHTVLTLDVLKKMVLGKLSVKHLSGPISIAQHAGETARYGFVYFVSFLAIISISLGVINLLPIPMLDGGNLMYCICELITGKPVSENTQLVGVWIGGAFIMIITIIALYNDLMRF